MTQKSAARKARDKYAKGKEMLADDPAAKKVIDDIKDVSTHIAELIQSPSLLTARLKAEPELIKNMTTQEYKQLSDLMKGMKDDTLAIGEKHKHIRSLKLNADDQVPFVERSGGTTCPNEMACCMQIAMALQTLGEIHMETVAPALLQAGEIVDNVARRLDGAAVSDPQTINTEATDVVDAEVVVPEAPAE